MSNFPPLRTAVLTGLVGLKDHLDILEQPDCPYDAETKQILRELLAVKIIDRVVEKEVMVEAKNARGRPTKDVKLSQEDQQMVLDEIKNTLQDLRTMGSKEDGDGDLPTNERIQIAKTKTNLLDQLLKMMERHTTAQKMQQFIETTVGLLDDLVTESDRELFMKRLESYR